MRKDLDRITRESGNYFVKLNSVPEKLWAVAEWVIISSGESWWWLTGTEQQYQDSDFDSIDERRIVREEPPTEEEIKIKEERDKRIKDLQNLYRK